MEALVVLALVAGGAAAFVALGAFLTRSEKLDRPLELPRRRRSHVVGGLLLAVAGALIALVSWGGWATNGYAVCENSHKSMWWPLDSRGNAVVVTSSVLEFESGTGGLFCENERTLRVQARARPSGGKPVFLGVGAGATAHRYLADGSYEIAASYFSLLKTRRVGDSTRRLAPPSNKPSGARAPSSPFAAQTGSRAWHTSGTPSARSPSREGSGHPAKSASGSS